MNNLTTTRFMEIRLIVLGLIALACASCYGPNEHERPLPADAKPRTIDTIPHEAVSEVRNALPHDPYHDVPDKQPVIHRAMAGVPDADGWYLANSTRGNFSVLLPGKFADLMVKSKTTTGGICVFHTVSTDPAKDVEFNALRIEIIGTRPAPSSDMISGMVKKFEQEGALVKRSTIRVAGLPAERLSASAAGVSAEFMMLSTPSDDYMLSVQSRKGISEGLKKDIDRFFQSFRMMEAGM